MSDSTGASNTKPIARKTRVDLSKEADPLEGGGSDVDIKRRGGGQMAPVAGSYDSEKFSSKKQGQEEEARFGLPHYSETYAEKYPGF